MALEMRLQNFKAFEDSGFFALTPLTCVVGKNSSGKSSLFNALLVLKQSLLGQHSSARICPLILGGPFIDAGVYSDVVYQHNQDLAIGFSFRVSTSDISESRTRDPSPLVELDLPRAPGSYRRFGLPWARRKQHKNYDVTVSMNFSRDEPFGPTLSWLEVDVSNLGGVTFRRTVGTQRSQHWRAYVRNLPARSLSIKNFRPFYFPIIEARQGLAKRLKRSLFLRVREFTDVCMDFFSYLGGFINSITFVGPFRTPPARRYVFSGFGGAQLTASGSEFINLLIVESLLSGASPKSKSDIRLRSEVASWLNHLGIARDIAVQDLARGAGLFQVDMRGAGYTAKANLADVGFGISQILPVIVQGLLTPRGGTYLVQQPEIHLHPDAQAALADFFLYLAAQDIRVCVETHSEYLLIRLRRRLAEGYKLPRTLRGHNSTLRGAQSANRTGEMSRENVSVLLASRADARRATVRTITIDDTFQFENMPDGFMSQALEDRMALLKAVARESKNA